MRVLVAALYPIFNSRIGGMDRFYWAFHKRAVDLNWKIEWVFPKSDDFEHYTAEGIQPVFLPIERFDLHLTGWLKEHHDFDVLITHFVPYNTKYPSLWKKHINKVICVDHMSRPRLARPFSYRFRFFLKGLINFSNIDRIIAVSPYVKKSIQRELGIWWKLKISVIFNGVDITYFTPKPEIEKKNYLFCIGFVSEDKGFQNVIKAIHYLKLQGIILKLKIAGDGPYLGNLKTLINNLDLINEIEFLGNITNQHFYFNEAKLTIVPSLWNEACPFTVLEALNCGAFIIGSDAGGIPDLLSFRDSMIYSKGDFIQLSSLIKKAIQNLKQHLEINEDELDAITDTFSLTKMVNNHVQILKDLFKID